MCVYRGDAVGQVVLAGDAQQLVLRQLKATERTWSGLLLQLWRIRTSVDKMQKMKDRMNIVENIAYVQRTRGWCWRKEKEPCVCVRWTHRTIASIFFLYVGLISFRYSGLINMAAKLKAEFFRPARWHSITADVSMGTTSTHKHTQVSFRTITTR